MKPRHVCEELNCVICCPSPPNHAAVQQALNDAEHWFVKAKDFESKLFTAEVKLDEARNALESFLKHYPKSPSEGACPWCDMGGSGYASNGDGHHDDREPHRCPSIDGQKALESLKQ